MRWFGLALLGILIAAAISVAASRLASQQIGLASQPISAGDALAPAAARKPAPRRHVRHHAQRQSPTVPIPESPSTSPTEPPVYPPPPESSEPAPSETSPAGPGDGEQGNSGGADD
jgi:hypothetical protein